MRQTKPVEHHRQVRLPRPIVIASALWREGHIRGPGRLKSSYGILGPYEGHKAEFELPGGSGGGGCGLAGGSVGLL